MITVRFASGFSLQYNDLTYVQWQNDGTAVLKKSKESGWSVYVPLDCVIEFMQPCRSYNPIATDSDEVKSSIEGLAREVRSLKRKLAKLEHLALKVQA